MVFLCGWRRTMRWDIEPSSQVYWVRPDESIKLTDKLWSIGTPWVPKTPKRQDIFVQPRNYTIEPKIFKFNKKPSDDSSFISTYSGIICQPDKYLVFKNYDINGNEITFNERLGRTVSEFFKVGGANTPTDTVKYMLSSCFEYSGLTKIPELISNSDYFPYTTDAKFSYPSDLLVDVKLTSAIYGENPYQVYNLNYSSCIISSFYLGNINTYNFSVGTTYFMPELGRNVTMVKPISSYYNNVFTNITLEFDKIERCVAEIQFNNNTDIASDRIVTLYQSSFSDGHTESWYTNQFPIKSAKLVFTSDFTWNILSDYQIIYKTSFFDFVNYSTWPIFGQSTNNFTVTYFSSQYYTPYQYNSFPLIKEYFSELIEIWWKGLSHYNAANVYRERWDDIINSTSLLKHDGAAEILFNTYYDYLYHPAPLYVNCILKDLRIDKLKEEDPYCDIVANGWNKPYNLKAPARAIDGKWTKCCTDPEPMTNTKMFTDILYKYNIKLSIDGVVAEDAFRYSGGEWDRGYSVGEYSQSGLISKYGFPSYLPPWANVTWVKCSPRWPMDFTCGVRSWYTIPWTPRGIIYPNKLLYGFMGRDLFDFGENIYSLAGIGRRAFANINDPRFLDVFISHNIESDQWPNVLNDGYCCRFNDYYTFIDPMFHMYGRTNRSIQTFNTIDLYCEPTSLTRYSVENVPVRKDKCFVSDGPDTVILMTSIHDFMDNIYNLDTCDFHAHSSMKPNPIYTFGDRFYCVHPYYPDYYSAIPYLKLKVPNFVIQSSKYQGVYIPNLKQESSTRYEFLPITTSDILSYRYYGKLNNYEFPYATTPIYSGNILRDKDYFVIEATGAYIFRTGAYDSNNKYYPLSTSLIFDRSFEFSKEFWLPTSDYRGYTLFKESELVDWTKLTEEPSRWINMAEYLNDPNKLPNNLENTLPDVMSFAESGVWHTSYYTGLYYQAEFFGDQYYFNYKGNTRPQRDIHFGSPVNFINSQQLGVDCYIWFNDWVYNTSFCQNPFPLICQGNYIVTMRREYKYDYYGYSSAEITLGAAIGLPADWLEVLGYSKRRIGEVTNWFDQDIVKISGDMSIAGADYQYWIRTSSNALTLTETL